MRASRTSFFFAIAFLVGCGSGADLGGADNGDTGGDDSGGTGDGANDGATDGATDTKPNADGGSDSAIDTAPNPDTPVTCDPLAAGATDVYVDKRFTGTSTGTATCPFTTILAGIAAAGTLSGDRTVHVAGAAPALVYAETGSISVGKNVTLRGDGPAKTVIQASGACAGAGNCAVRVDGGGTLEGFTVTSSGGEGIVASAVAPTPIVRDVDAVGSKANGVLALGDVNLGPNIVASKNGAAGVDARGGGTVSVHFTAGSENHFDENGSNGINVEAGASIVFEGGTASSNTFNGLRLAGPAPAAGVGASHSILGLVAKSNKNTGISVFHGQSLKLRNSTLVDNANLGLFYSYPGGTLDLGSATDAGGNVFGGATGKNGKAGIFLCHSLGPDSQPAESNSWGACPPSQTTFGPCDVAIATYTDVAYSPAAGTLPGNPVVAAACTVGP